jgi:hypothetical protein
MACFAVFPDDYGVFRPAQPPKTFADLQTEQIVAANTGISSVF